MPLALPVVLCNIEPSCLQLTFSWHDYKEGEGSYFSTMQPLVTAPLGATIPNQYPSPNSFLILSVITLAVCGFFNLMSIIFGIPALLFSLQVVKIIHTVSLANLLKFISLFPVGLWSYCFYQSSMSDFCVHIPSNVNFTPTKELISASRQTTVVCSTWGHLCLACFACIFELSVCIGLRATMRNKFSYKLQSGRHLFEAIASRAPPQLFGCICVLCDQKVSIIIGMDHVCNQWHKACGYVLD